MAVDWEPHHAEMKSLYIEHDQSLEEVRKHFAEQYDFKASKVQYEAQFKRWNLRKNLRKNEWKYVSRKIDERRNQNAGKKSAVFFNGSMIPFDKVKKEISRHVHPNDQFHLQEMPQSPEDVTVCTPPFTPPAPGRASSPCTIVDMRPLKRTYSDAQSLREFSVTKRPVYVRAGTELTSTTNVVSIRDLRDLPYFQFQRLMRSQNVVNEFNKMLTANNTFVEKLIDNYWTQPSSLQHFNFHINSFELDSTVLLDTYDGFESSNAYSFMQHNPLPVYKPFGIELLNKRGSAENWDILEWSQKAAMDVPALLAHMPRISGDDFQQSIDLLLGPPTVESVRYMVEVGVYLISNNMSIDYANNFIELMLRIVPWTVLKFILSTPIPLIQTFEESVFKVATRMGNVRVIRDLLHNSRLNCLVKSSGEILVKAVQSSNVELVRLLLNAGARVDLSEASLVQAKTVEIARMLIGAGAALNGIGEPYGSDRCTALCAAVRRHDVKLARYLINAGADVNLATRDVSPLEMAASEKQRELLELLLKHGAHVNREYYNRDVLLCAAVSGSLDCVRLLVEAGAAMNAPIGSSHPRITPLHAASSQGHLEMVTFLLDHGANVNASAADDNEGFSKTVLITAVENNNLELVKLLLNADADVNLPSISYYGCTALEVAKARPVSSEIIDILIAKGARDPALPLDPHQKTLLCKAVYEKDLDRVQYLINLGVQIDIQMIQSDIEFYFGLSGPTGVNGENTVIMEIFRLLIDKVKDFNAQDKALGLSSLLAFAAPRQNIELVEILIDAGADINAPAQMGDRHNPPLTAAAIHGNDDIVRFLLGRGAVINTIFEGDNWYTTALQASLYYENVDTSYLLLANGARVNAPIASRGTSELTYAVLTGSMQLVRELLDRGAEINSAPPDGYLPWIPDVGFTALQAAACDSDMAVVQLLLENGADVNAPGYTTTLQFAIGRGHFQLTQLFLEAGADVNAQALEDDHSALPYIRTALETAACHGRLDILHLLLKVGADMHLSIEGRYVSAASLAREYGHIVIAEILEGWKKMEALKPSGKIGLQISRDKK